MCNTIILIPASVAEEVKVFKLSPDEATQFLNAIPGGCTECYPGTGIYKVADLEQAESTYASLFTTKK